MQAMGVGQGHAQARPVHRQLAAQGLQHGAHRSRTGQFGAAAIHQQVAQAFQHSARRIAALGQAEQPAQGLAGVLQLALRGDEGQAGPADLLAAAQPPQALAQRQRLALLQRGEEAALHAAGGLEPARGEQQQFVEVFGALPQRHQLRVQGQGLRGAAQGLQQLLGILRLAQHRAGVALAQGAGQQLQQVQVLVRTRGDADGQVDDLPVAPVHAFGEMQQAHAGAAHEVAGLRSAVGDGDALAEVGGALGLAGLEPGEVARLDQAVGLQGLAEQFEGGRLVRGPLLHADLLRGQFEHIVLLSGWPGRKAGLPKRGGYPLVGVNSEAVPGDQHSGRRQGDSFC